MLSLQTSVDGPPREIPDVVSICAKSGILREVATGFVVRPHSVLETIEDLLLNHKEATRAVLHFHVVWRETRCASFRRWLLAVPHHSVWATAGNHSASERSIDLKKSLDRILRNDYVGVDLEEVCGICQLRTLDSHVAADHDRM